jgi:type IV secretory pathway VirB4 component
MTVLFGIGLRLARQRGTTANVASIYPFHGGHPTNHHAPYLGSNVTAGGCGWFFDPFELYGHNAGGGTLTNSNMLIVGEPGYGKSACAKSILWRQAGYYGQRRFIAVSDPKGEYTRLGHRLGLAVIRLAPGGRDRINPLDPGPGDPALSLLNRQTLMVGLLSVVLHRDLTAIEETLLTLAVEHVGETVAGATLHDLASLLGEMPESLTTRRDLGFITTGEMADARTHVRLGLGKLLERTLRGMFDGPTTVNIDWEQGPGIVLDLSAVFGNTEALPLVQMAATAWLQTVMADLQHQGRRGILVDDEVWAMLATERAAKHLQARLKLCRLYGIWNILICHRLSDLRAQADDGTATNKIAAGLLADVQTRVVFRQAPDQTEDARQLLHLTETETTLITRLGKGRALWLVANQATVVAHVIGAHERHLFDTDAAMSAT